MQLDVASILWSVVFGAIGTGMFIYGKKQSSLMPLICGTSLMIDPWFVTKAVWIVVVGVVLTALPYFISL